MSNRLQLFRKRMAAFEGTADPLEAINSGYYVHAPGKLLVDQISFIARNNKHLRLLVRRLILEYRTPQKRYAVHPAIKVILEKIPF